MKKSGERGKKNERKLLQKQKIEKRKSELERL